MRPCLRGLLALALLAALAGGDDAPPRTFQEAAQAEGRWLASLANLHLVHRIQARTPPLLAVAGQPPVRLECSATATLWIAVNRSAYRYQMQVDRDALAAATAELGRRLGRPLKEAALRVPFTDHLLVRKADRSELLDAASGHLGIRWLPERRAAEPSAAEPAWLDHESGVQPLLAPCLLHHLTDEGFCEGGLHFWLWMPQTGLAGVTIADERAEAVDGGVRLSGTFACAGTPGDEARIDIALTLRRHASEAGAHWLAETYAVRPHGAPAAQAGVWTFTWQELPRHACAAVPRCIAMSSGGETEWTAEASVVEDAVQAPLATWRIDPLLARTISDETAHLPILPTMP